MTQVEIYTDGACSGNPGPGGWGAVLISGSHRKEISGSEELTTNNRMELLAAIKALQALKYPCSVNIYTDSSYVFNAFEKGWIHNWMRNGWINSKKNPVENKDLWLQLVSTAQTHTVIWHKVKGHADNAENNRCDALARMAIKNMPELLQQSQ